VSDAKPPVQQFMSIANEQSIIETWRVEYNRCRPHSSLKHLTPNEFIIQHQANEAAEEAVHSG
jgi:transposase InsO family protein